MNKLRKLSSDLRISLDGKHQQPAFHQLSTSQDPEEGFELQLNPNSSPKAIHRSGSDLSEVKLEIEWDDNNDNNENKSLSGYCFSPHKEKRSDLQLLSAGLGALVGLALLLSILGIDNTLVLVLLFIYACALIPFVWVWERLFRQPYFLYPSERAEVCCGGFTTHNFVKACYALTILYGSLCFTFSYFYAGSEVKPFIVVSYTIFGSLLNFMTAVLIWDVITFSRYLYVRFHVTHVTQPITSSTRFSIVTKDLESQDRIWYKRRAKLIWLTFFILWGGALLNGYVMGDNMVVEVWVKDLPECLDGYRIGMLSDVHAGPMIGLRGVRKHVEALNEGKPDLILLAGDMADGPDGQVGGALEPIYNMEKKPRDGIYFVTGNHEYLHGGDGQKWMDFWKAHGIKALFNEHVVIPPQSVRPLATPTDEFCNETFSLFGTGDLSEGGGSIEAAWEGVDDDKSRLNVLVAHQALTIGNHKVDLQISGHVHAGQIFPLTYMDYSSNKGLFTGMQMVNETKLYVGEGTVAWGPRNRLFSSNERTIIVMRRREEDVNLDRLEMQEERPAFKYGVDLAFFAIVLQFVSCLGLVLSPPARKLLNATCGAGGGGGINPNRIVRY